MRRLAQIFHEGAVECSFRGVGGCNDVLDPDRFVEVACDVFPRKGNNAGVPLPRLPASRHTRLSRALRDHEAQQIGAGVNADDLTGMDAIKPIPKSRNLRCIDLFRAKRVPPSALSSRTGSSAAASVSSRSWLNVTAA